MSDPHDDASDKSLVGRIIAIMAAVGTGWILVIMAVVCADIIGRGAFNRPILGVPEFLTFSIVGIVFLQLPQTLRTAGLTRADVLLTSIGRRSPTTRHAMQFVYDLVGAALFAAIAYTTWPLMVRAFANDEFYGSTGVVQIPTGPLKVIIIVGCVMMTIQFLIHAWWDFRAMRRSAQGARL
jgi:TRAP-type C4-dicarboxylate transport system permease small subunit